MKYRELTELTNTELFQRFVQSYNFEYKFIDNTLCIKNNCLLILIYGFYTEDILYFDFVKTDDKTTANIGRLISDSSNKDEMKRIYAFFKKNHIQPVSNIVTPNTIKVERYFMTYIKIISDYLSNLLRCDLSSYNKYFEPAPPMRQQEFEKILKEF